MPSVLNSIAAHAKAHHESVNAAAAAVYSPRGSMQASRKNSTTSESPTKPPTNLEKTWNSLKKSAKEHHEGVNAAYNAMYAPGVPTPAESRAHSAASSRRHSVESVGAHEDEAHEVQAKPRNITKAWNKVKKTATEHHKSVNSAYMSFYGGAAAL